MKIYSRRKNEFTDFESLPPLSETRKNDDQTFEDVRRTHRTIIINKQIDENLRVWKRTSCRTKTRNVWRRTSADLGQTLDDQPFVTERTVWSFENRQENFTEKNLGERNADRSIFSREKKKKMKNFTSIWIFKFDLKFPMSSTKFERAISNKSKIKETPLRDNETHKWLLIKRRKSSDERKTGPAFWRTWRINRKENIRDLTSKFVLKIEKKKDFFVRERKSRKFYFGSLFRLSRMSRSESLHKVPKTWKALR